MGFLRRLLGGPAPPTRRVTAQILEPSRDDAVLEVVGEASYQPALERLAGGRTVDGVANPDHIAALVREPDNRYDRNAIRVDIEASTVGYLSRDQALAYKAVVESVMATGQVLGCRARLIGGWNRGAADRGSIGVLLHLGSPAECMVELMDAGAALRVDHRWAGQIVAFTGDSTCRVAGYTLDRPASIALAEKAGLIVLPRVTKRVQLLIDCDRTSASGNELKARDYDIPVVDELEFWQELGVTAERMTWGQRR